MASANPLIDLVSCTICFELFQKPKILKCHHSFCDDCIKKMKINQHVVCPICRKTTNWRDVKDDFNKMSLIDVYKQQEIEENQGATHAAEIKRCESCKKPDRLGIWHCSECKIYLCSDCEEVHKNIPVTQNHTLVAVGDEGKATMQLSKDLGQIKDITTPRRMRNFMELVGGKFEEVKSGQLHGSSPWRMCSVGDNLWCACGNGLYVYNKWSLELMKSVVHNTIRDATAILQDPNGNLVVACASKGGLLHLDKDGKFKSYIYDGSFSDIAITDQKLYAYEFVTSTVNVFELDQHKQWVHKRSIEFNHHRSRDADAMCVTSDYICFTIYNEAKLMKYSHEGTMEWVYGTSKRSDDVGCLWGPTLCDVDEHGNALIVDCWKSKHYVQICRSRGDWVGIKTTTDEMAPTRRGEEETFGAKLKYQASQAMKTGTSYAVVDDDCKNIWLMRVGPGRSLVRMQKVYHHHYDGGNWWN